MKKVLFTIAAAVMMFAATSCKKENVNEPENFNREPEAYEFLATVNGGATTQNAPRVNDGMGTLATFDPETLTQVMWQVGDVITVNGVESTCTTNPGKGENFDNRAYFENESIKTAGTGFHAAEYHASYSTSVTPNADARGTLNAIQYYNPERQAENLPMYATSDDHWLNFSNICAAIKIYVPCTADSIVISNTSAAMNGTFTVSDGKATMTKATPSNAEKQIRIEKRVDGASAQFHACDSLFIAIPAGTYQGFEIAFYEGNTCVYTTGPSGSGKDLTVAANKIYRIVGYKYPNHLLPGKFSVSTAKKVQFTTGNLKGAVAGTPDSFEDDQTDYRKAYPESGFYGHFLNCENSGIYNIEDTEYHALSAAEFDYLLQTNNIGNSKYMHKTDSGYRANADRLHSFAKVDGVYCLLVAPDGAEAFNPNRHEYTLKEVNSMGLLCLPMAGYRSSTTNVVKSSHQATSDQAAEARYWTKEKPSTSSTNRYNVEIMIDINDYTVEGAGGFSISYRAAGTSSTNTGRTIRLVKRL